MSMIFGENKRLWGSILTMCVCFLFLFGCGTTVETKNVSFDEYTMDIGTQFETLPVDRVEGKRTQDRIIAAYSYETPVNSPQLFEKNIIIGILDSKETTSLDTFTKHSISSIKKTFYQYEQIELDKRFFVCREQKVNAWMHNYSFDQVSSDDTSKTYYIAQLYFLDQGNAYVISAGTDTKDDLDIFASYFASLSCSGS